MLSALHTSRRSRVPTLHHIRRRTLSDVSGHSSSSESSSKGPSSALKRLHLITNGVYIGLALLRAVPGVDPSKSITPMLREPLFQETSFPVLPDSVSASYG
ncbi:hypothetical protein DPMN_057920 [Dreissena polymorpha]|uniref:Uncharacterized protein n=1 Tax=Dreissena polymorpha TaxID=45954 RepID=A0A9D4C161_DREPO|nr:hypothetical protein DPMN_057920 [Dreissena polymorpha]